jgi:hypothetical protein
LAPAPDVTTESPAVATVTATQTSEEAPAEVARLAEPTTTQE